MKDKKSQQLEMNISTAQGRLVKDILWMLLQETNRTKCFVCGKEMSRETFSIEHKIPWLDSDNPKELFFRLDNISFSHLSCNISSKRITTKKYFTKEERRERDKELWRESKKRTYSKEKRKQKYLEKGY